jgi:MFS family permease
MWAPLSELYGRRIIYILYVPLPRPFSPAPTLDAHNSTYGPFVLFHLGCGAAQNITTLLVCRFLAGLFGSSPLTNAGAVISDTFDTDQRALALSMFALAPYVSRIRQLDGLKYSPCALGVIASQVQSWVQSAEALLERTWIGGGSSGSKRSSRQSLTSRDALYRNLVRLFSSYSLAWY